jgi:hypothetical protein
VPAGKTVLLVSYNCALDGRRDAYTLRSYFLPHKFDVIDDGVSQFADRRMVPDPFAKAAEGGSSVCANFGVLRVVKKADYLKRRPTRYQQHN